MALISVLLAADADKPASLDQAWNGTDYSVPAYPNGIDHNFQWGILETPGTMFKYKANLTQDEILFGVLLPAYRRYKVNLPDHTEPRWTKWKTPPLK